MGEPTTGWVSMRIDGVRLPLVSLVKEVHMPDDERLIVVRVGREERAYLLRALAMPPGHSFDPTRDDDKSTMLGQHVVNDKIADVPISVTYCEKSQCTRVFRGDASEPMHILVAGWSGDSLMLELDGHVFPQNSDTVPVPEYPFEVSSWKSWSQEFPKGEIYLGRHALRYLKAFQSDF